MKSWKVAVLTVITATAPVFAYAETYHASDLSAIVIDIMGAAAVFVNTNITLIGVLLLLGFVMGVVGALFAKAKNML